MTRRDRQRSIRETTLKANALPSRRSLRERAAADAATQLASPLADQEITPVTPEPTPLRRRRDARAAVNAERPTNPEDVPIVEEAIALASVWADPTAETESPAVPESSTGETAHDTPVPADTFTPLPSAVDSSSIAAAFIAPPSAFHRPRFASAQESSPVPAAKASTQAAAPQTARWRSLRSPAIIALAVPALLGTVALPAYAFSPGDGATAAIMDANAALTHESPATQSLTVSDDVTLAQVERDGYSATSAEELEQTYAAAGYIYDSAASIAGYLAPSTSGWWRPLPGEITSKYGPRGLICNGAGCSSSFHEGMDFGGACGTPIKAAAAGTVVFTGNAGAFGNRVIIDHGNGLQTIYGHLLSGSYEVSVGDVIEGGTVIAEVGATGVVSGCHLDLKVSVDGEHTNPAPFLRERGVTV
ncbi:M23 family metallopeptidase [Mycetocola miduiensis]|uniref:M23 family metallopeptidase n=1 Tax=Mycetocola miduiensis TaxID=995034 RepID=UPI001160D2D8|nr:M23 family metallopeptidase [Mycetocola miduiensis]